MRKDGAEVGRKCWTSGEEQLGKTLGKCTAGNARGSGGERVRTDWGIKEREQERFEEELWGRNWTRLGTR